MQRDADESRDESASPDSVDAVDTGKPEPDPTAVLGGWPAGVIVAVVIASLALLIDIGERWLWRQDVTPIAVINIPEMVASDPGLGGESGRAKIHAVIKGLVDAGYIVLDSDAVLGAPPGAYVTNVNQGGNDASGD